MCGWLLVFSSWLLVVITLPFSLCVCFKIVQEYERAVIFRLGRIKHGEARSPGLHFILPCIDKLSAIDLRTQVYQGGSGKLFPSSALNCYDED